MYCKKCGTEINDDSEYCSQCGTKQKNDEKTESIDNADEQIIKKTNDKNSGCLKYIALFFFVIIAFILAYFIGSPQSEIDKTFKRDAGNGDITVAYDIDIKNLEMELTITPNVDIEDLTLYIVYYDKNKKLIKSQDKYIGNVEKEETIEKTIHLTNLTLEEMLNIYEIQIIVSEGKVNKFA